MGSGAAFITHTLYRMMFNAPDAGGECELSSRTQEALVKLIADKTVDVVVVAAGQPAPLIANMKPEAQKFIKLLKFDPNHPLEQAAADGLFPLRGQCEQLSQPAEGELHDDLGRCVPRHLRFQHGHAPRAT